MRSCAYVEIFVLRGERTLRCIRRKGEENRLVGAQHGLGPGAAHLSRRSLSEVCLRQAVRWKWAEPRGMSEGREGTARQSEERGH